MEKATNNHRTRNLIYRNECDSWVCAYVTKYTMTHFWRYQKGCIVFFFAFSRDFFYNAKLSRMTEFARDVLANTNIASFELLKDNNQKAKFQSISFHGRKITPIFFENRKSAFWKITPFVGSKHNFLAQKFCFFCL